MFTCLVFFSQILSLCSCSIEVEQHLSGETNDSKGASIKEVTFKSTILSDTQDCNKSLAIVSVPDGLSKHQTSKNPIGFFAGFNNSDSIIRIPVITGKAGYIYDESSGTWEKLNLTILNATGQEFVNVKPFDNDWMNAYFLDFSFVSTVLGDESALVRLTLFGELTENDVEVPVAAWIDVEY